MSAPKDKAPTKPAPKRRRRLALGCLLTLGVMTVLTTVAVVLTLRVIEQRWESSLREALASATGGEIHFEDLQLGLSGTTLTQVQVDDSAGQPVLAVRELHLALNPWTQSRDSWQADAVRLEGVEVSLHRDELRWGLPETCIALLLEHDLQELPWPELRIGVLEINELSVELTSPEARASVSVPSLSTTGLVLILEGQVELALGPVSIPDLELSAPESEIIDVSGITAQIAPWSPGGEGIELGAVQVERVSVDLGARGWRVPDAAATALAGGEGIPWPAVEITSVTVAHLGLAAGGGAERSRANVAGVQIETTTLTLGPEPALAWGPVATGSVTLSSTDAEVVHIDRLNISAGSIDRAATRVALDRVAAGGLQATLRKGERWFAVPTGTWALFARPGAPGAWSGLHVGQIELGSLDAQIIAPSGTMSIRCGGGSATDVGLDPSVARPWRVGSAVLDGLTIASDEPFATVARVSLQQGGLLAAEGVELWTRLRKNRSLKLPPVVRDHAPSWVGGDLTDGGASWYGVELGTLPWQPKQATLRDAIIHLDDARNADPPLQWMVAISSASIGPMGKERLPFSAVGTVAEGSFEANGGLRSTGTAVVNLAAKQVSLKALTPYVDDLLDTLGLKVKAGTVGGDMKLTLQGSRLKIEGPARARRIELGGKSGVAGLANATLQALTGERTRVDLQLNISGDLSDASFSPLRLVIGAVVRDLVGEAVDSLVDELGLDEATETAKKKGKKKANQAEQAIENIAGQLQDALMGGSHNSGNKKNKKKK